MNSSQKRRGASSQRGQSRQPLVVADTDQYYDPQVQEDGSLEEEQDPMIQPPAWLFCLGGLEFTWGCATNVFQVVTSMIGIIGWQEHELINKYGYEQAGKLILSLNPGIVIIAVIMSVGAQIGIQAFTQQISKSWKQKRVSEHESTKQALIEVVSEISIGQIMGYISILVCACSDYMFVTQIDSTGSLGSYILMTFFALILGCSSTYILMDGIQRWWSGTLALRAWRMWQSALNAHFETLARQYQP